MRNINIEEVTGDAALWLARPGCFAELGQYWYVDGEDLINDHPSRTGGSRNWQTQGFDVHQIAREFNRVTKENNFGNLKFSQLVVQENKIACIKEVRAQLGLDLKEAKNLVEDIIYGGSTPSLPFTPYKGVKELEGMGYFPFKETRPFPLEAADILGYKIGEAQEIALPTYWGISFLLNKYRVEPGWANNVSLGWDPHQQKVVRKDNPSDYITTYTSYQEAIRVSKLMTLGYNTGLQKAREAVLDLANTLSYI